MWVILKVLDMGSKEAMFWGLIVYFDGICIPSMQLWPMLQTPSSPPALAASPPVGGNGSIASRTVVIIVVAATIPMALVALLYILYRRRKMKQPVKNMHCAFDEEEDKSSTVESLKLDFGIIRAATDNFSDNNKLGQGGFGAVYEGKLPGGQEMAVKRMFRDSDQGEMEFKNEVLLLAKLQHRNLVRLKGFCLEGDESSRL